MQLADKSDASAALAWIVATLRNQDVPFVICGGLAANGYGSDRPLNDIDIFVPGDRFDDVAAIDQTYVSKPAGRYRDQNWDVKYIQFVYRDTVIEIGSAEDARIFDSSEHVWTDLTVSFESGRKGNVLGLDVPLMDIGELVSYKRKLGRVVDIADIRAIEAKM